jgi:3',5'-cyclic AMP phosphodiesterase CpdA
MSNPDFTIFHLSDLHIQAESSELMPGLNTSSTLAMTLQNLHQLKVTPNLIVITGDLTHEGDDAVYERLRDLLSEFDAFGVPVLLILGNHDRRLPFYRVIQQQSAPDEHEPYCYTYDIDDVRIFALDTLVPDSLDGALDAAQLTWLESNLAASGDRRKIILMHHPPTRSPIPTMHLLQQPEALERLAREYGVLAVLCGHIHFSNTSMFGGAVCTSAPSTAFGIDPTMQQGRRFTDRTGFNLVTLCGRQVLVTPMTSLPGGQRELLYVESL